MPLPPILSCRISLLRYKTDFLAHNLAPYVCLTLLFASLVCVVLDGSALILAVRILVTLQNPWSFRALFLPLPAALLQGPLKADGPY